MRSILRAFLLIVSVAPTLGGDHLASAGRADLARSYLRFEQTLLKFPPEERRVAALNRDFDAATLSFFTLRFAEALEKIDALSWQLLPEDQRRPARRLAWSLKLSAEPPVLIAKNDELRIRVESLYRPAAAGELESAQLHLRFRSTAARDNPPLDHKFRLAPGDATEIEQSVPEPARLLAGRYQIEITDDAGTVLSEIPYFIVEKSLDTRASEFRRRLAALKPTTDALRQAIEICRARVGLLADEPSQFDSAQFLADPLTLSRDLEIELMRLERDENPYRNRVGDYWRVIVTATARIPMRVFQPTVAENRKPPLVVAFHGAGGDENMFLDGYGAGELKRLAEKHGFLLASPATTAMLRDVSTFEQLLSGLALDYDFDPQRVFVIGHSMGAAAALAVAAEFPKRVAGVVCIAGGGNFQSPTLPPTCLIVADLDGVAGADRLAKAAQAGRGGDRPIEVLRIPNYGHTLVVPLVLPKAWDWLSHLKRTAD